LLLSRILLTALILSFSSCSQKNQEVGSQERPLNMFFIPSDDTQTISRNAETTAQFVAKFVSQKLYAKDEGFYIRSAVPNSYIAVIESFVTGRSDFAALGTFDYVLAKDVKKAPIEAILNIVRGVDEITYKAAIIAREGSGIDRLEDFAGKKFAYVDPASAAGFVLPALLFEEKKINLGESVFAQRHDNVVTMVYQKQVDGGAIYYSPPKEGKMRDARMKVLTQFPDVEKKVKIVGFTREIPNSPWVLRTNLYSDPEKYRKVKEALQEALIAFSKTEEGKSTLDQIYSITGFVKTSDEDFTEIRKIFVESNSKLDSIILKAKK
jgi:phosphonate transport system substrate-binding protein